MATITFTQTNTSATHTDQAACSGATIASATLNRQIESGGSAGSGGTTITILKNASKAGLFFESAANALDTAIWASGNWNVTINVSTANSSIQWDACYICRVNSSGTSQETLASKTAMATTLSSATTYSTGNFPQASTATASTGDRVYIVCVFKNTNTHSDNSIGVTPNQNITSPYTTTRSGTSAQTAAAATQAASGSVGPIIRYVNTASTAGGSGKTNATSGADRAYATLGAWESNEQATAAGMAYIVYCSGTTADSYTGGGVSISGWSVGSITVATDSGLSNSRHQGVFSTSYYRVLGDYDTIYIGEPNVTINGLQVVAGANTDDNNHNGIYSGDTNTTIKNCVVVFDRAQQTTYGDRPRGIWCGTDATGPHYISNNIIYDFAKVNGSNGGAGIIVINYSSGNGYVYHNTVVDCDTGISDGYSDIIAKNNLVTGSITADYSASFNGSSGYNVSSDTSAPGTGAKTSQTITYTNSGSDNFHTSDTDAQVSNNLTLDSNIPITTDIDGEARPSGSNPVYAGADENLSTTVSGSSAQTAAAATQAAAGSETFAGTSAQTAAAATQASSGKLVFASDGGQTITAATQSSAGWTGYQGPAAQTAAAATQAAAGLLTFSGTAAQTGPAGYSPGVGGQTFSGSAAQNYPGGYTQAGAGWTGYQGPAAQTAAAATQAASGAMSFSGSAAQTHYTTQTATGALIFSGAAAETKTGGFTQAATGQAINAGTSAQTITAATQAAAGGQTFSGSATQTKQAAQVAAGALIFSGSAAQTYPGTLAQVAAGWTGYQGPAAQSYAGTLNQAASGALIFRGSPAHNIARPTQTATGQHVNAATGAQTTAATTQAASGGMTFAGTSAQSYGGALSQSATGGQTFSGTAAQTYPGAMSQSAAGLEIFSGGSASIAAQTLQTSSGAMIISGGAAQTAPAATQSSSGDNGDTGAGGTAARLRRLEDY